MPDPSEPGPRRPQPAERATPAPIGLRRRVLARVNAEPEPLVPRSVHRARRAISSWRVLTATALLIATAGVIAIAGGFDHRVHRDAPVSRGLVRVGDHAELRLAGMAQPPIGEVYEVWLTRGRSAPAPTNALFTPNSAGTASVLVPGSLRGVREVTVTAEPVGGSRRPTSPVVLSVHLSPAGVP